MSMLKVLSALQDKQKLERLMKLAAKSQIANIDISLITSRRQFLHTSSPSSHFARLFLQMFAFWEFSQKRYTQQPLVLFNFVKYVNLQMSLLEEMKWLHSNSQYTSFVLFTSFILWSAACAI
jgi:hypothetical protein